MLHQRGGRPDHRGGLPGEGWSILRFQKRSAQELSPSRANVNTDAVSSTVANTKTNAATDSQSSKTKADCNARQAVAATKEASDSHANAAEGRSVGA